MLDRMHDLVYFTTIHPISKNNPSIGSYFWFLSLSLPMDVI